MQEKFSRPAGNAEVTNDPGNGCFLTQADLGQMTYAPWVISPRGKKSPSGFEGSVI